MVQVKDIGREIERFAPKFLMESYDNVGLMVGDEDKTINKVLLSLDCTNEVIEEAVDLRCELIITHHPLLFKRPKNIVKGDLLGNKLINLIKEDIALYSCHTNLDSAKGGINETIVRMLGFESQEIIEPNESNNYKDGGIGRLVKLDEEIMLNDLIEIIKKNLNVKNMRIVRGKNKVRTIAIINGSGQDFFYKAKDLGADCIITGDTTYHFASDFKELGISIIDAGHFSTEYLVFLKTLDFLKEKFKDVEFIASKKSEDPYEFV
ncbi:Nif3-like dinuclear metal center hexameric protein [Clostridium beijerinckii]|uniref:GTP cyclohydrolase 1 type 2 homolog n=1 Tax=Clostridium beijerinckii TaxID=1520 RepID=A0A7X9SKB8_CLOBE|nr:Nif3-like dinuclear metal center hexameric protein [Clostridium beijerinckii]NMF03460.1 Nif3-like dinuclear metal center hexameric protein [Clostridium beijerinckii]UYZ35995.1 Nif3-like dinuclear metal center hexameric protein [Clostridium beijerinckii]